MIRRYSRRAVATTIVGIVASVSVGVGLSTGHSSHEPAVATPAIEVAPEIPAAFAIRAVRVLNGPAMIDPSHRAAAVAAYLATNARSLVSRFTPGAAFEQATGLAADQSAGRPTIAEVIPVSATTESQSPSSARVAVWVVSVVGTERLGQLVESWSTETLALKRSRGRWQVAQYMSTPGPVPAATQAPSAIASALAAVKNMRSVDDAR